MKLEIKKLNLKTKGLKRILGELELAILEQAWLKKEVSVKEVHKNLKSKGLAYTTVMTVMGRLAAKGLLGKRKVANAFLYHAKYSKYELEKLMIKQITYSFKDLAFPTVMHFIDDLDTDKETLDKLEEMIKAKKAQALRKTDKCD